MFKRYPFLILSLFLVIAGHLSAHESVIHHELSLSIDPEKNFIDVSDRITLPEGMISSSMTFMLLGDLDVVSTTPGVAVELVESGVGINDIGIDREDFNRSGISKNRYRILIDEIPRGDLILDLTFSGRIHYTIKQQGSEYARGFSQTPGIISGEGVYLSGSTWWVPYFDDRFVTFELTASVPEGWDVVSQGGRTLHEVKGGRRITRWNCLKPMEEIYLIAARFCEYSRSAGAVDVMAFLRTCDENLAGKYLETTAQYMEMYSDLIGPYPFSKFALVENFWETGYGMPSFTLLGEKVIRFPFILHSSYPHELLHNWWGNSVYVDFDKGNWCEGLTVYMADHLIKEQRGQGAEYRRGKLQRYTDYVNSKNDFPISKFLSRSDAATEAVGYGKAMMMWNMLRQNVGDALFIKGVRAFYSGNRFEHASYDDIREAFESVTDTDFKPFFKQWVTRTGAPELRLSGVEAGRDENEYTLKITLKQIQREKPYFLDIPIAISFKDNIEIKKVLMTKKKETFEVTFKDKPLYLRIDPEFDIFRKLHYNEIPPSLSKAYGSDNILILLPSAADEVVLENYSRLARIWAADTSLKIEIKRDDEMSEVPADKAVWIFGWDNSYRKLIEQGIKGYNAEISGESIRFGDMTLGRDSNSFVISVRHPRNPKSVLMWLTIGDREAIGGLSRKLPHYGKYSYLAFEGDEPTNIAKGNWEAVDSPMASVISWDEGSGDNKFISELPEREALAVLAPDFSAERMMGHVEYLASDGLEGRGLGSEGIEKAAEYIADRFERAGLKPAGDNGTFYQTWEDVIDAGGKRDKIRNVIGVLPGTKEGLKKESVIVCAHYDHLGYGWPDVFRGNKGRIHPGADDNASGVAVMIELAAQLGKSLNPDRNIVFVAFTAEESGLRGSKYYVRNMKRFPAEKCIGVLNLDTVGRLGDRKLLVLNSSSAREWRHIFMGSSYVTGVESEMVTQDLDASDQVSFIEAGVPAVQIFSGPHEDYHRPTDTVDKIDAAGLVKVAAFTREAMVYLAERMDPLQFSGKERRSSPAPVKRGGRTVSTGCIPDFAYDGSGVRVASVSSGSPAAKAGIMKGDIIILLGDLKITNLREYSNKLKLCKPGDRVEITFLREGREISKDIVLGER